MWRPDALAGRIALVTGATRGIGHEIARGLLAVGCDVWLCGRTPGALDDRCAELSSVNPGRATPLYFDVADPQGVKTAFAAVQKARRQLDILVNNAGIMRGAAIEMAAPEMMDETFATNLRGLLLCSQYGARLMARSGGGSIVNVASIIGRVGTAGQIVYGASKAGVIGATLSLAKELAARQIRVNAVAPGIIESDLIATLSPAKRQATIAAVGLGRIGTPADVAALCVFLASDQARYITGQVIGVDGGLVM